MLKGVEKRKFKVKVIAENMGPGHVVDHAYITHANYRCIAIHRLSYVFSRLHVFVCDVNNKKTFNAYIFNINIIDNGEYCIYINQSFKQYRCGFRSFSTE